MNIQQMMKQAQAMQKKVEKMQDELSTKEFSGNAGGDMVSATVNGKGELLKLSIKPEVVDPEDISMLEDLVIAAFNDAKKKSEDASSSMMSGVLPEGMKMPF